MGNKLKHSKTDILSDGHGQFTSITSSSRNEAIETGKQVHGPFLEMHMLRRCRGKRISRFAFSINVVLTEKNSYLGYLSCTYGSKYPYR